MTESDAQKMFRAREAVRRAREAVEEAEAAEKAGSILGLDGDEAEADPLDCPQCGAKVNGEWAEIDTFPASSSGPAESDPFCLRCVPWRWKPRLLDVLKRAE